MWVYSHFTGAAYTVFERKEWNTRNFALDEDRPAEFLGFNFRSKDKKATGSDSLEQNADAEADAEADAYKQVVLETPGVEAEADLSKDSLALEPGHAGAHERREHHAQAVQHAHELEHQQAVATDEIATGR